MDTYIYNFNGTWEDSKGNKIHIKAIDECHCLATYVSGKTNKPLERPWLDGKPSIDMMAKCDSASSPCLDVELGLEGSGFFLSLDFDISAQEGIYKKLIPALDRLSTDNHLDQYYHMLSPLEHFTKVVIEKC